MFIIKFDIKIYIDKSFIYLIIERIVISCKICFDRQFYHVLFSFFTINCSFMSIFYVCITIMYLFSPNTIFGAERFQYYNYRKKNTLLNCIINIHINWFIVLYVLSQYSKNTYLILYLENLHSNNDWKSWSIDIWSNFFLLYRPNNYLICIII